MEATRWASESICLGVLLSHLTFHPKAIMSGPGVSVECAITSAAMTSVCMCGAERSWHIIALTLETPQLVQLERRSGFTVRSVVTPSERRLQLHHLLNLSWKSKRP
ncbi:hypothetical protein SRHO_G00152020 [Serrasalmus rhombeus]